MPTTFDLNAVLRLDFRAFVEKVFATLNPGQTYEDNWHIGAIVWLLLCVENRHSRRAMIHAGDKKAIAELMRQINHYFPEPPSVEDATLPPTDEDLQILENFLRRQAATSPNKGG